MLLLAGADRSFTGIIKWRPISNSPAYAGYPAAGNNFSSVTISSDGRGITFGSALSSDPDVLLLANTLQTVKWFYVFPQNTAWYIVDALAGSNPAVLMLADADPTFPGVILWKPIHNFPTAQAQYPAAGNQYNFVTVSSNGRSVQFGAQTGLSDPCSTQEVLNMVQEYTKPIYAYPILGRPTCSDFTSSGDSPNFTWSELTNHLPGNPHYPWGMVKASLRTGLETTRANYSLVRPDPRIRLTSGYRTPDGNVASYGEVRSLHTYGRAADMYSFSYDWTPDEFTLLRNAALDTGNLEELFYWEAYPDDHHLHAAW